ncbi:hypothetical protein BDQ17DRAFT_576307 [Cyathus striatus]|nr:hypothetical protein BDQ17DRAFT_576307 [Cyathus striatus]
MWRADTSLIGLNILLNTACLAAGHQSDERYDPPKCHPDTRKAVIGEILSWVDSKDPEKRIKWISGPAGAGKSSIAQTIAEICDNEGKLVSSFFFSRTSTSTGRDDGKKLVPTIAYHLSIAIPATKEFILAEIERNPGILTYSMKVQVQKLVMEPLQHATAQHDTVKECTPELVIIDGLDECNDRKVQVMIIQVLTWVSSQLSVHLRFLITSRPELEIRNTFDSRSVRDLCTRLVLDDHYAPDKDIEIYLRSEFARIKEGHTLASVLSGDADQWPSERDIWRLVRKSSGQFIYASTVIKYVENNRRDPREQLRTIIDIQPGGVCRESPYAELDAVYTHILETVVILHDYNSISPIFMVLSYTTSFLWTSIPRYRRQAPIDILTISKLAIFLGFTPSIIKLLLVDLHSVMHIPSSALTEHRQFIHFSHASFRDFLRDSSRSGNFFISKEKAHVFLGKRCFTTILEAGPSPVLSEDSKGGVQRYAFCAYFYHMIQSEFDEEVLQSLRELENAQEVVQKIILQLSIDVIGDILDQMFTFNLTAMDSSDLAVPATERLSDICGYISSAVDEVPWDDNNSLEAIISFKMSKLFPKKANNMYYFWKVVVLDSPTRAKSYF